MSCQGTNAQHEISSDMTEQNSRQTATGSPPLTTPQTPSFQTLKIYSPHHLPRRFYTPPQMMLAGGGNFISGSGSGPGGKGGGGGGGGGGKRGRGGDDGGDGAGGSDLFRMRQKQRYSNIQD